MDYTKQTNSVLKTLDATQSMNSILLTKEFIEHAGRKGMKWYQNVFTSGSKSINSTREAARSINTYKGNKRKQKTLIKTRKKVSTMSNKELQDEINRMNLEQSYKNLVERQSDEVRKSSYEYVDQVLSVAGSVTAVAATAVGLYAAVKGIETSNSKKKNEG